MKNRPATKDLLRLYEELDVHAQKAAQAKRATCSKGCYHCCHMLATITVPEGLLVAEYLLARPDWKWWAKRLRASAKKTVTFGADRVAFWKAELFCPLLDEKTGACQVYDVRPSNCRYYYVVSEPELCKAIEGKSLVIDLYELEARVWKYSLEVLGQRIVAPLDLMVLQCMHDVGSQIQQAVIRLLLNGLPNPLEWLASAQEGIQKTVDQDSAMSRSIERACEKVGLARPEGEPHVPSVRVQGEHGDSD